MVNKLRTRLARAVTALAVAGGVSMTGATAAHADGGTAYGWQVGHDYIIGSHWSGGCLDDSNDFGLRTYECNQNSVDGGWQRWRVVNWSSGYGQLKNVNTGRCLDWSSDYGLRTYECNNPSFANGYQKWALEFFNTSAGATIQVLRNGINAPWNCLDESEYGVRGYPCNDPSKNSGYQSWWVDNAY